MVRCCGYFSTVSRRKRRKAYPVKAPSYPVDDKGRRHSRRLCERGDTSRSQTPPDASHGDSGRAYLSAPPPSGNLHGTPGKPPSEHLASAGFPCGSLSSPCPCSCVCPPGKGPRRPTSERTARELRIPRATGQPSQGSKSGISPKLLLVSKAFQAIDPDLRPNAGRTLPKAGWGYQPALCDASDRSNVTLTVFPRRHSCPRCGRRQRTWSSRNPRLVPIPGGFRSSRPRSKAGG